MVEGARLANGARRPTRDEPDGGARQASQAPSAASAAPAKPAENALARVFAEARLPGTPRSRVEDFLPDIEAITERRHSPYISWTIYAVAGFIAAAILWMTVSMIDQVATAPGVIRPAGKAKTVSHPEGGRVARIFVKDGDQVRQGQELVALDADQVDQEISKTRTVYLTLSGEVARLEAETASPSTPPIFPAALSDAPAVIADQLNLWRARQSELQARRTAADSVIEQTRARVLSLQNRIKTLEETVAILARRESALRGLVGQQYFPELQYLGVKRDLVIAQGELASAREELKSAEQTFAEAAGRRSIVDREWMSAALKRLGEARAERDRALGGVEQQLALRRNLVLRAPIDGIVNGLRLTNPGQAVRPGELVVGVVPSGEARRIEVEIRVTNADIGLITPGQPCTVKLQTYDWIRHGALACQVTHIAADATAPDPAVNPQAAATTQPYFVVLASIDRDYLGEDPKRNRVTPGMTATVDLHIGRRSIMGYFTDRLFSTVGGALKER
ncbi:MAG: HlyD family type I secretion periplasmic adaptor subunit [Alphaproteobacteria bacterium]|nr:HlyD family type I secretion periplasmic adaptor subunit [Alphaproteobacteria bacterium]MCW5740912.1 HlyD family type I secretion periplasmic adaptor subunit [Alphaproteobacteria bacterium]